MITQPDSYQKALDRANNEHLYARGPFRLDENTLAIWISHPEDDSDHYTVRYARGASTLTCNCKAHENGLLCKHRARAHELLVTLISYGIKLWDIRTPEPDTKPVQTFEARMTDGNWRDEYAKAVLSGTL